MMTLTHFTSEQQTAEVFQAAQILQQGGLVALPTETVYGLGTDASNESAVKRLYTVKGRPFKHPVIVHIGKTEQLSDWAQSIPKAAYQLAEVFWPGPLTLILRRAAHVRDWVTGGQNTVGIRIPNHPLTLTLLNKFAGGIAAPSANRFGHLSPTTAEHVRQNLGDDIDFILDGGPCQVGIESIIVDLTQDHPVLLRPGMITARQLSDILGIPVTPKASDSNTRVPGTLPSHYAPQTPLRVMAFESLLETATAMIKHNQSVAVLAFQPQAATLNLDRIHWQFAPDTPEAYAQMLYLYLHQLDQLNCEIILVESVPDTDAWAAIHDRLKRAATHAKQ